MKPIDRLPLVVSETFVRREDVSPEGKWRYILFMYHCQRSPDGTFTGNGKAYQETFERGECCVEEV